MCVRSWYFVVKFLYFSIPWHSPELHSEAQQCGRCAQSGSAARPVPSDQRDAAYASAWLKRKKKQRGKMWEILIILRNHWEQMAIISIIKNIEYFTSPYLLMWWGSPAQSLFLIFSFTVTVSFSTRIRLPEVPSLLPSQGPLVGTNGSK